MGSRVVPIIPDEGRTFGMDPPISEFGIFSQFGQNYTPVDHKMLMNYKESESGQIIQRALLSYIYGHLDWHGHILLSPGFPHSSVLHLLLHVWISENRRSGMGNCDLRAEDF